MVPAAPGQADALRHEGGRTRLLHRDGLPALSMVEFGPGGPGPGMAGDAPVLLLHGAYSGAWCWEEGFASAVADRGRHVAALDLRGRGGSEGRGGLARTSLDDFVRDLRDAVAVMPSPPVLVGHSLGGYLCQLLLGQVPVRGIVLMGSLPPDGLAAVGPRLALTNPKSWLEAIVAAVTRSKAATNLANLGLLFGDGVAPERIEIYAKRMVPESPRALAEAHLLRPVSSASLLRIPALVMNGMADKLVWPATALRTSLYHGAEYRTEPDGGHFLMLDTCWPRVASEIGDWLDAQGL